MGLVNQDPWDILNTVLLRQARIYASHWINESGTASTIFRMQEERGFPLKKLLSNAGYLMPDHTSIERELDPRARREELLHGVFFLGVKNIQVIARERLFNPELYVDPLSDFEMNAKKLEEDSANNRFERPRRFANNVIYAHSIPGQFVPDFFSNFSRDIYGRVHLRSEQRTGPITGASMISEYFPFYVSMLKDTMNALQH